MTVLVTLLDADVVADNGDVFWDGESSLPEAEDAAPQLLASVPDTIRLNDHGPAVASWQKRLQVLGFSPGDIDGHFGLRTDTATRSFQRVHGLTVDGIVGPKTRAAAEPSSLEVPRKRTPLSESQLLEVLWKGHVAALGAEPSRERIGCAWAQNAFEHGHGLAVFCNNLGNITAFSWPGEYYVLMVRERVSKDPDVWKTIRAKFRAHDDAIAGAADYWKLIAGRFKSALSFFDAGDPDGAARALGAKHYYTDYIDHYAKKMTLLYGDFQRRF